MSRNDRPRNCLQDLIKGELFGDFFSCSFHNRFIRNRVTLVGCPKLDPVDYAEKLTEILKSHNIKSITLVRMEVPCCGGLENALKKALAACGKLIPWQVEIISIDGQIKE